MEVSRRKRIRSLFIVHTSMLIFSLGSAIISTGVWPYLQALDSSVALDQYGFVVATDALAQVIFSPIFGYMADKLGGIRLLSYGCGMLFAIGNLFYANISLIPKTSNVINQPRLFFMIFARLIVGIGTAVITPVRYYVAKATYPEERTTHISFLSLFQLLGFVLGPALQAALSPIGEKETVSEHSQIHFDMYTACGYVGAVTGLLNILLYLPGIFEEFNVSSDTSPTKSSTEADGTVMDSQKPQGVVASVPKPLFKQYSTFSIVSLDGQTLNQTKTLPAKTSKENGKPHWLVTLACCFNMFAAMVNYAVSETTSTPIVMDQFAWSRQFAVQNLGITMSVGGVFGGIVFSFVGLLSKRFDERKLLITLGFVPLIFSKIIYMPMASYHPQMYGNFTVGDITYIRLGCRYDWCKSVPQLTLIQFYITYVITICSYPFVIVITASIFSKILGNRPQGFWSGILTTSGSLSRVVGPIVISLVYEKVGIYASTGIVCGLLTMALVISSVAYKRLVPLEEQPNQNDLH